MEKEIWRDIKEYEGYYQVSNSGRFRSLDRLVWNGYSFTKILGKILNEKRRDGIILTKDGISKSMWSKGIVIKTFEDNIDLLTKDALIYNSHYEKHPENKVNPIPVICLTTDKPFNSINEANRFYNIKTGAITRCCKGERQSAGKLADGTKLVWKFL